MPQNPAAAGRKKPASAKGKGGNDKKLSATGEPKQQGKPRSLTMDDHVKVAVTKLKQAMAVTPHTS